MPDLRNDGRTPSTLLLWLGLVSIGSAFLAFQGPRLAANDDAAGTPRSSAEGGAACPIPSNQTTSFEMKAMARTLLAPSTPPIDRRHPALLETATFALG